MSRTIVDSLRAGPLSVADLTQIIQGSPPADASHRWMVCRHNRVQKAISRARQDLDELAPGKRLVSWRKHGQWMIGLVDTGDQSGGMPCSVGA